MTHLFTFLTLLTLLLSLFSTIFTQVLLHHTNPSSTPARERDSIQSFTCRLYRSAASFNDDMADLNIPVIEPGIGYPRGFRRVCIESKAAGGLVAVALGLGVLSVGIVGWGLYRQRGVRRAREERWVGKWSN